MYLIQTSTWVRLAVVLALLAGIMSTTNIAFAQPNERPKVAKAVVRSTPEEAQAMLESAIAFMANRPLEQSYAAFNNRKGRFVQRDLYVFVVGMNGIMHAHGGAPEGLVGLDVNGLKDVSGKLLIREMLDIAKASGSGSVDYIWLNRLTNKIESKTTVFKLVGDNVVAVGSYVPRSSSEQALAFLKSAIAEMSTLGPAAAFREFNDPSGRFIHDDLYVFVVGMEDMRFYTLGSAPSLVGTDVSNLRDSSGKPIIREMVDLAKQRGSATYDYLWRNPANNKIENKHSFIQHVDGYLVGVGYYTN
jgi:cytochrome c